MVEREVVKGRRTIQASAPEVEQHCQPPGRLLDLGCGTGRLLIHAARRGYAPVGVDLSAEMLAVALDNVRLVVMVWLLPKVSTGRLSTAVT